MREVQRPKRKTPALRPAGAPALSTASCRPSCETETPAPERKRRMSPTRRSKLHNQAERMAAERAIVLPPATPSVEALSCSLSTSLLCLALPQHLRLISPTITTPGSLHVSHASASPLRSPSV
eukprot:6204086-Pleurochrysis_carterae.AAC.2